MPKWDITLSREAGVYTKTLSIKTLSIKAETKDKVETTALEQAKQMSLEEWEYDDICFQYFLPLIQIEGTEQIQETVMTASIDFQIETPDHLEWYYFHCENCDETVDFWKHEHIKDTGHEGHKIRQLTELEFISALESCTEQYDGKNSCLNEEFISSKIGFMQSQLGFILNLVRHAKNQDMKSLIKEYREQSKCIEKDLESKKLLPEDITVHETKRQVLETITNDLERTCMN